MNKVLVGCMVSTFFLLSHNALPKEASQCDQGADCSNIENSSGVKNGIEVCKDGKVVRRKVTYRNGLKEGLWECFDQTGKLTESRIYKDDKLNGPKKLWLSNIKQFEESEYKDDELNGVVTTYNISYSDGKSRVSGINKTNYKDGVMHGVQTVYDANGKEVKRFCYNKARRVDLDQSPCLQKGPATESSVEKPASSNSDSQKNGPNIKTEYFKSGALKEKFELAGPRDYESYQSFFENSQLRNSYKRLQKSDDPYSPELYEYVSFTDAGLVTQKGECAISPIQDFPKNYCPRFSGVESQYNEKGELIATITFKDGKRNGPSIWLNKGDNLKTTTVYENDIKKKTDVRDLKTSRLIEAKEFFDDGSEKK